MGLPMFCEPEPTESKSTVKADSSAPARSAIRRQRTVRYSPHPRDRPSISRALSNNQSRDAERRSLLDAIRRRESAILSSRTHEFNDPDVEGEADLAHAEASQRRRLDNGRALLRDALSYERPDRRMRMPATTAQTQDMREPVASYTGTRHYPVFISGSRMASVDRFPPQQIPENVGSPPPEYMPTPPYTYGDSTTHSPPNESTPSLRASSYTPRFAPAHRFDEAADAAFREYAARHSLDGPREHDLDGLPPLRRMGRRDLSRSNRFSQPIPPRSAVDGLGDRQRSFSPEDDSWETLLTTIAPDERLPSAHSSFTSATASASSLSSNSASSYGTLVTAPSSSAETLDAYLTICDNTDSEGSDADDLPYPIMRRVALSASEEAFAAGVHARSRVRALQLERAEQLARHRRILEREEELQQIQVNLNRLQRQVPEDWWAAADRERNSGARPARERL